MIVLQGNQVARHFGGDTLFANLQIEIQDTSRTALVGRNGAGKSTLLKIIAGIESPDEGLITKGKGVRLGYLAQNTGLSSSASIWDEMLSVYSEVRKIETRMRQIETEMGSLEYESTAYQRLLKEYDQAQQTFQEKNGYGYEAEIRSVLHGFRFTEDYWDKSIETLSGGQKTRLALAKLLLEKPELLILDEPTNHLDIDTLAWLENYLLGYQGALLIVSHDRYFLDKVVNEVYEITRGEMYHYHGNYSHYLEQKEQRLETEWKAYEKQQDEIQKLEDFVARNLVRASTTKRAQSRRKQLEKIQRLDKPKSTEKSANFLFQIEKVSGNVVLQVADAAIGYDAQSVLSAPIDFEIRKKEAFALVGPNGIGKSTLLKSIIGRLPFLQGSAKFGANVTIGYYDQEQAALNSNKIVLNELWDEHSTTPEKDIRSVLGSFLFSGEDVKKSVPQLSGGEKARLALAKLSMDQDNFLILDEPTNHLDIDSKEVLEQALIDYEGTILFVSHDRYFINRIATKVIELSPDGSQLYIGDYDYYVEKKQEEAEIAALLAEEAGQTKNNTDQTPSKGKQNYQAGKDFQRQVRNLQRKIETIELDLATTEEEIEKIHADLSSPAFFDDHVKLQEFQNLLVENETRQQNLLEEWENLSLELEEMQE